MVTAYGPPPRFSSGESLHPRPNGSPAPPRPAPHGCAPRADGPSSLPSPPTPPLVPLRVLLPPPSSCLRWVAPCSAVPALLALRERCGSLISPGGPTSPGDARRRRSLRRSTAPLRSHSAPAWRSGSLARRAARRGLVDTRYALHAAEGPGPPFLGPLYPQEKGGQGLLMSATRRRWDAPGGPSRAREMQEKCNRNAREVQSPAQARCRRKVPPRCKINC